MRAELLLLLEVIKLAPAYWVDDKYGRSQSISENSQNWRNGREVSITATPVLEFWRRHSHHDDSLRKLRWAHDVNSWQRLVQLSGDAESSQSSGQRKNSTDTFLVEGDVYLSQEGLPVMLSHGSGQEMDNFFTNEPVPFKEWLLAVAATRKAIKVNIESDQAVKPALQYMFALKRNLHAPVVIHGNVLAGPASEETPLNGRRFVSLVTTQFPECTLSVGWTQPLYMDWVLADDMRYTWRQVFDMLDLVHDVSLNRPVMVSARASLAQNSLSQLAWLLSIRSTISLHLWSDLSDVDRQFDWLQLARLKQAAAPEQILYDLLPEHSDRLAEAYDVVLKNQALFLPGDASGGYDRYAWRTLSFDTPHAALSTFVHGDQGPAAIGYPGALLLSERRPVGAGAAHVVSACVHFVPNYGHSTHRLQRAAAHSERSDHGKMGVAVHLTHSMLDIGSVHVDDGIKILISHTGFISIIDQDYYTPRALALRQFKSPGGHPIFFTASQPNYLPQVASQLPQSAAYAFKVTDYGSRVVVRATPVSRCDWQYATLSTRLRHKARSGANWQRELHMDTVPGGSQRRVILTKDGDASVDAILFGLAHTSAARRRAADFPLCGALTVLWLGGVLWRWCRL